MSIAQILEEVKTLPTSDLESLEHSLRLERLRRAGKVASPEETSLLRIVNRPLVQIERFDTLSQKWEEVGISDEERAELLEIVGEREGQNAERVEAVARLSELRGVDFQTLWKQLMGEPPALLIPRN